ncbi:MAG TPA: hypothetical protein VJB34_01350 [Bdellovibrionota bacterium]|nr:hypothetical protein [Bdellovibrionota bacterium]
MDKRFVAIIFVILGTIVSLICLIHTTPITMTAFFFISLPCYVLSNLLYVIDILSKLAQRLHS